MWPQAQAAIATTQAEIAQQQSLIDEAQATVDADKAAETFAEQNNQRFGTLAKEGYGSVQNAQQAASQIAEAKATVAKDAAALEAAQNEVETLNAKLTQAKATLAQTEAVLEQARTQSRLHQLRAPVDGMVGSRTLRVGQYVQPGTAIARGRSARQHLYRRQLQGDAARRRRARAAGRH